MRFERGVSEVWRGVDCLRLRVMLRLLGTANHIVGHVAQAVGSLGAHFDVAGGVQGTIDTSHRWLALQ